MKRAVVMLIFFMLLINPVVVAYSDSQSGMHSVAILPFDARGATVKDYGSRIADVLFAKLVTSPQINLVDRQKFKDVMDEHHLNLSGMVNPQQAIEVGRLSGAKLLIAGSINELDNHLIIVAKVIGTETGKVLGESVTGRSDEEIFPLVEVLGDKLVKLVEKRSADLVAAQTAESDPVAVINQALGNAMRPTVRVSVPERHVGLQTIDPAAETELLKLLQETGFKTFEMGGPKREKTDILIKGEGFSEFAGRRGDLISVKARLELKAVDQATGEIIATDRQSGIVVDLSEQIAGKKALAQAAEAIAVRMLPLLVKNKP